MTPEQARLWWLSSVAWATRTARSCWMPGYCGACQWYWQATETASLAYDLAVAARLPYRGPSPRQRGEEAS